VLDAVGVVALGEGKVGHVGVEAASATGAAVLGVGDDEVDRPAAAGIAQVMESSLGHAAAAGRVATARTAAPQVVAAALLPVRGGQVLHSRDSFGDIGDILARACHRPLLQLEQAVGVRNMKIGPTWLQLCCYSLKYPGQFVAFSPDGTRILAHGHTRAELGKNLEAAGIHPCQVVESYIDGPEDEDDQFV
jgi:hypothetical protein